MVPKTVKEFIEAAFVAALFYGLVRFSVGNTVVEGSSMLPNLEPGERMIVNKLAYIQFDAHRLSGLIPFWEVKRSDPRPVFHPPARGEVIVFKYDRANPETPLVKRVIGLPGETVEMRNGAVFIDGKKLDEPYLTNGPDNWTMARTVVPEGQYFVLGDNRRVSNDSRYFGPVPFETVIGKVWAVYWPPSRMGLVGHSVAQ